MKFMLTKSITAAEARSFADWKPEELQAHITFILDLQTQLERAGELVLAEGLAGPDTLQIVTAKRRDAPVVSDGPFAESKEFLAGFWIVNVKSQQRAIEIAAAASAAPGPGGKPLGSAIEVRQVMGMPDD